MAKRRKIDPQGETAVLIQSGRRCSVCFGIFNDVKVKEGQIAHLDDDPSNNDADNLAWLCILHHAQWHTRGNMTKGLKALEVKTHRARLYRAIEEGLLAEDADSQRATFSTTTGDHSTVINAARDVNIRGGRKAMTVLPPSDAIGSDSKMRSYIEYLVGQYIDWRNNAIKSGIDRRPFFPGMMHNLIKRKFGARTNLVPQRRFPELVSFVQTAIDKTIWGKNSRDRNYHSFDEHCAKFRGA